MTYFSKTLFRTSAPVSKGAPFSPLNGGQVKQHSCCVRLRQWAGLCLGDNKKASVVARG